MRGYLSILTLTIFCLLVTSHVFSQKTCDKYVIINCDGFGKPFKYSGQSKDGLFELGQKSLFKITVYNGFEYRLSLCAEKTMKGVYFRLREDNTNKTILYDSSAEEDNYNEKMFFVSNTKNLFVEVIVPEGDGAIEDQQYNKRFGCVGVLVEYYKRMDTGLE